MTAFPYFERNFPRNVDSVFYLQNFLVSAVASILLIRVFLNITGFFQLGGTNFHIAHMLWGGLFMTLAIALNLTFFGKRVEHLASILAGIGFGAFIDELGKFITRDNNYFFEPTIALIYVIFVLIYLGINGFARYRRISKTEYLVNSIELAKEAVLNDLNQEEKTRALSFLRRSNQNDPFVLALRDLIEKVEVRTSPKNLLHKLKLLPRKIYRILAGSRYFNYFLIIFFLFQAGAAIYYSLVLIYGLTGIARLSFLQVDLNPFSLVSSGQLVFSIISGIFVILGIIKLRFSRVGAYSMFKIAVLITIFLTQFFAFYREQFSAVYGLAGNLLLLIALDYMMVREERIEKEAS